MFPFHIWLPEAHVEAPTVGSVLLAGILLKLGVYGFLRFSVTLFPEASLFFSPLVYLLSIIGIIYTSFTAIRQTDIKRIIAYSSIAHMNLVTLGIFSFTIIGIEGSILQSISHGFVSGAVGKSAQLGLHSWLPDAMEGPTPVSALIHAATMVTAGSITACFAATTGLFQNDIKRVIAYSTCSQLGYMVFACGLSSYDVGIFHLSNHAFFKALLFLGAGSVIHAISDEQDMRRMGGLRKILPFSYAAILIGSLALVGFPFLSGFYSKDIILEIAYAKYTEYSIFAYFLGVFSAFCTSFYSTRLLILVFLAKPNGTRTSLLNAHEGTWQMTLPLLLLAIFSVFVGFLSHEFFIGFGTNFWSNAIFIRPENYAILEDVQKFSHSSVLEIVWTILPAIVLLLLAIPSFALLYSLDELIDPDVTLKIIGHQWYWSYEYSDYSSLFNGKSVAFDSYMVATNDLTKGAFRLLEVDNRVVLPVKTHIRLLITAADVLHSWAVPAFGIKVDACPGRLTQASLFIKREGLFFGQCSEICGVNHGFMPIAVKSIVPDSFISWIAAKLESICLVIQILTGIFLAMHYTPHIDFAFNSVEHIMRDVNSGWIMRYAHANGASMFFIVVYCHIFRGLYYGSYIQPRGFLWISGVIIFFLMMATAFMGYVLPWGQMSFWGATVITNLFSAIPFIGSSIVEWLWGGFSVDNATLNRFFSLHYLMPFVIAGVTIVHLSLLHKEGSNNPIGHSDNYIPANPLVTPPHIVPEWYFLPFYAILRSIPDKLGWIGQKPVESPFIEIGILSIAGNCRMCLVEIEKAPKPVASCALPVSNNLSIFTDSPSVKKARENVLETILLNHPLDCPICDQGGECDLQDQTKIFGGDYSRFYENKRVVEDKPYGSFIKTIMTRCIHCTRCVRFSDEIAGTPSFGTLNRGSNTEVGSYVQNIFDIEISGTVIDLCPVGALTFKTYAFKARPWELRCQETIDFTSGVGSPLLINFKESEIVRIQPKIDFSIQNSIISDKIQTTQIAPAKEFNTDSYVSGSSGSEY
eukprot:gene673-1294_t